MRLNEKRWRLLREIVMLLLGSLLAAVAVNVFYVPIRLTMGGVSGIVSIIYQLTGRGEFLPFGVLFTILNIPLFILGWRFVHLNLVWRSLVGTVVYSVLIDLTEPALQSFFSAYLDRPLGGGAADPLVFCLIGGAVFGAGLGLVLRAGYTTGGIDILAVILRKKTSFLSIGQFLLILDALIVLASAIAYIKQPEPGILLALYSFISLYISAKGVDIVLEGFDFCRTAYIISTKSDAIAVDIMQNLDRGVTELKGRGLYTGQDRDVLLCVLSARQVPQLKNIVAEIDPAAFVFVHEAREVLGEGFERSNTL